MAYEFLSGEVTRSVLSDIDAIAKATDRINAGAKRADVVSVACIQNGMTEEIIAVRIDKALTSMGE